MSTVLTDSLKYDALSLMAAPGDVIRLAFYSPAASIDATTPTYTATGEVTDPGASPALGAGGRVLTGRSLTFKDGVATVTWDVFPNVTPSTDLVWQKLLLWNETRNRALRFVDLESPRTWNAGVTTYVFDVFLSIG